MNLISALNIGYYVTCIYMYMYSIHKQFIHTHLPLNVVMATEGQIGLTLSQGHLHSLLRNQFLRGCGFYHRSRGAEGGERVGVGLERESGGSFDHLYGGRILNVSRAL